MNNVLSTKVTIYRNVKDFKFTPKLNPEQKQQIVELLEKALKGKMSLLNLNQADENVISFLKSNNLLIPNTQNLFVSKADNIAINMFNGEHLSIVAGSVGWNKNSITKAVEMAEFLSNKIAFAFNDEYGYLMSDINKIGSGVKLETNIMLSAITSINKIEQIKQNLSKLGFSLKETKYPAVYTLSTRCNLGINEKKIYEDYENTLIKLQDLEIESAKMMDATNHDEMLDKTSRSLAILNSAHLMTYDELYNIIVNLRLGLNIGLNNTKLETINKLQQLITNKTNDIVTPSELKNLAQKAKEILKGE